VVFADVGGLGHGVLRYHHGASIADDLADDPCDGVGELWSVPLRQSLSADEG